MKIIAHRANISGPNLDTENSLEQIDKCISFGYDVEIDVRLKNKSFYLGHDNPEYQVPITWLQERKNRIWIHCKNFECLDFFSNNFDDFNYFWHQEDDYTITSKNIIWAYPGKKYNNNTVIVMPEWSIENLQDLKNVSCFGICTDYPEKIK